MSFAKAGLVAALGALFAIAVTGASWAQTTDGWSARAPTPPGGAGKDAKLLKSQPA